MNPLIVFLIVGMVVAIIYLGSGSAHKRPSRKKFLEKMVSFLEGRLEDLEQYKNSFKIVFDYKGQTFWFEDIEEQGFHGENTYKAFLKAKTSSPLTICLTERSRSSVRPNVENIQDISNRWAQDRAEVGLPKELEEFSIYTNHPSQTRALLSDEKIAKIFSAFKNRGSRGYPSMSLEVMDGTVVVAYHTQDDLLPSLLDLQQNISSIEKYLDMMLKVTEKIKTLYDENS